MVGETENQFFLTRAALSTGGRAKSKFLLNSYANHNRPASVSSAWVSRVRARPSAQSQSMKMDPRPTCVGQVGCSQPQNPPADIYEKHNQPVPPLGLAVAAIPANLNAQLSIVNDS
jgi:hypothetical protein